MTLDQLETDILAEKTPAPADVLAVLRSASSDALWESAL